jgi:hypothetical protein
MFNRKGTIGLSKKLGVVALMAVVVLGFGLYMALPSGINGLTVSTKTTASITVKLTDQRATAANILLVSATVSTTAGQILDVAPPAVFSIIAMLGIVMVAIIAFEIMSRRRTEETPFQ